MSRDKKHLKKRKKKRASISKEIIMKLVHEGFFNDWKTMREILKRLSQRGYTIKGKKVGLVGQLLTYLCREDVLEREELPQDKQRNEMGKWKYRRLNHERTK